MLERVPTRDGASLAVKRKPVAGGTPVIFLHGLAVNADLWDLPEIRGRDFRYRSLAAILHQAGYDIWLVNWRGHGAPHMHSTPPVGQDDWCLDHFILLDLPAVVEHVIEATGRRPFVIGASMGAMTLAGYAQGARRVGADEAAPIVADPELARERGELLAGAVFVEFPAALRWPAALFDENGRVNWGALLRDWARTDGDANYVFELAARWGWLHALVETAGVVPLNWLRREPAEPWWQRLPKPLAERMANVERAAVQGLLQLAGTFTGATNHRAEVVLQGRRYIVDHMKAGVLLQLARCVRRGAFVSLLGAPEHVYSEHYPHVTVPSLVIVGGRDRIANAEVTQAVFFERMASGDKTLRRYEDIAHGEFEAAPVATERVYPVITAWLADRDKRARRV